MLHVSQFANKYFDPKPNWTVADFQMMTLSGEAAAKSIEALIAIDVGQGHNISFQQAVASENPALMNAAMAGYAASIAKRKRSLIQRP